jgi:acetylornithine/succinyldiaminopimelate/putrescine aminotransferase
MIAVDFGSFEVNKKIIDALILRGVFTDWFLFAAGSLRIAPPLVISDSEIRVACNHIIEVLNGN